MKVTHDKTTPSHLNEVPPVANSVVPVPTAVPAFIGYTPQASYQGKSYLNIPQKITSLSDFEAIYCYPDSKKNYQPAYYLVKQKSMPDKGDYVLVNSTFYAIVPDPNTIYYLYNSIKLFYENGGGDAYIVSIGSYGEPSGKPITPGDHITNPNVQLSDLLKGLTLLKNEQEPTMYICPEATLLSVTDNGQLMQEMLMQNEAMGTAISILDIIGGRNPDQLTYTNDITTFRKNTGSKGLKYGSVYYPFIGTTVMAQSDIDYTNLFGGDITQLAPILISKDAPNHALAAILSNHDTMTVRENQAALLSASKTYTTIINHILSDANMLPPSGGIAGVIAATDNEVGPWKAPANTGIVGVKSLPIHLTSSEQENLNVGDISGKSVNPIRSLNGLGILIYGAQTLDGNSIDWKYIPVRRTIIFLEQSCQLAINGYRFAPNDSNTWNAVIAMISSFLHGIWKHGGLQGASAADAFSVQCGLGTTMTSEDILQGLLKVTIKVAVVHPAEFIVLTLEQSMNKA